MSNLSNKDLPVIRRALKARWNMSEEIKEKAITICKEALENSEVPIDEKRKTIDTLIKIDKLNLDEEKIYTPKISLHGDISKMKDEELLAREKALDEEIKRLEELNARQLSIVQEKPREVSNLQDVVDSVTIKNNNVL